MYLVPIEDVLGTLQVCFPDVPSDDFVSWRDKYIALNFWDIACCLVYPYKNGLYIAYLGVLPKYRETGYAKKIIAVMAELSGGRPMYAEVETGSAMYNLLWNMGWMKVPVNWICPPWGSVPATTDLDLICSVRNNNHLAFIKELYTHGYELKDITTMMRRYKTDLECAGL